jgi:hypothetical protein
MSTIAPTASVNAVLSFQNQMAIERARATATTTETVIDVDRGPATVVNLSADALLFLGLPLGFGIGVDTDSDALLVAELLEETIILDQAMVPAGTTINITI